MADGFTDSLEGNYEILRDCEAQRLAFLATLRSPWSAL